MSETWEVISRDITLNDVKMTVDFYFYPPYPATREDPGFDGEIEIEAIWIDEYNVINLFGERSLEQVEEALWKIYNEVEGL